MGEIDIESSLAEENPNASLLSVRLYADALRIYVEASKNVRENGAICVHPRTGSPIENPYLAVQARQAAALGKMKRLNTAKTMQRLNSAQFDRTEQSMASDERLCATTVRDLDE